MYSTQPAVKEFKKNENSGGVMGMMNDIISEVKTLEHTLEGGRPDVARDPG